MTARRFTVFLAIVLSVWAVMHGYVFWRLASVPWVAAHVPRRVLFWAAVALAASYPLARFLNAWKLEAIGRPLELVAANWIGVLFLLLSALVVADAITLGGWCLSSHGRGHPGLGGGRRTGAVRRRPGPGSAAARGPRV